MKRIIRMGLVLSFIFVLAGMMSCKKLPEETSITESFMNIGKEDSSVVNEQTSGRDESSEESVANNNNDESSGKSESSNESSSTMSQNENSKEESYEDHRAETGQNESYGDYRGENSQDESSRMPEGGNVESGSVGDYSKPEVIYPEIEAPEPLPWENGGKLPSEYTLEEYEALTEKQKVGFINYFESNIDFENWRENALKNEESSREEEDESSENSSVHQPAVEIPWENGGKQPSEYTWAEYEALTDAQQEAFFESFSNTEDFKVWMEAAQSMTEKSELPWENGGKQPSEYTWEEYEALTDAQQEAFFESFQNVEDFKMWMEEAQRKALMGSLPWENGGKQPSEYTWEEYEALTDAQQEAFFESFKNIDDFKKWLSENQPE